MPNHLGRILRRQRDKTGRTSDDVAREIGASGGWLRQVEEGRIRRPGRDKLAALAPILNLDVTTLLAASDQLGAKVEVVEGGPVPKWAVDMLAEMRAIRQLVADQNADRLQSVVEEQRGEIAALRQKMEQMGQAVDSLAGTPPAQARRAGGGS